MATDSLSSDLEKMNVQGKVHFHVYTGVWLQIDYL